MRVVDDIGVLVSGLIRPQGVPGEVLRALRDGRFIPIYSTPMVVEITDVIGRPYFRNKYHIQPDDSLALVNLLRMRGDLVIPKLSITACRDPKDNKFLETTLAGNADAIISSEADLLVLHPFENIPIPRPTDVLAKL